VPAAGSAERGRVLGLDLGDVRIGVAVSDDDRRVAVPVGTVHVGRPPGELRAIADLVAEHEAVLVVLGDPIRLDGTRGERAGLAERFAEALRAALPVPVVLQDERLTTVEAERALREAGVKGRDRRAVVDATAAQRILQSFLDVSLDVGRSATDPG
jgi:putative Holliday junction resolvase